MVTPHPKKQHQKATLWVCVLMRPQVLVTHGGVEMGQGLHIKMAQVAAHELGVPVSKVFIAETSTDKVRLLPGAGRTECASKTCWGCSDVKPCRCWRICLQYGVATGLCMAATAVAAVSTTNTSDSVVPLLTRSLQHTAEASNCVLLLH